MILSFLNVWCLKKGKQKIHVTHHRDALQYLLYKWV